MRQNELRDVAKVHCDGQEDTARVCYAIHEDTARVRCGGEDDTVKSVLC